ncbi:pleckstrin homology domain-containing family A member 3-like isoform X2 [Ptychodera flava]|uniref:pleckstrin homology domain-containing family A member 3-like isoform X2 n=1 Tax=Ptychodera flava TaxID=63121 RepID=UPI00396A6C90
MSAWFVNYLLNCMRPRLPTHSEEPTWKELPGACLQKTRNMPEMEGMLYKWTNYISGWQPRWFILDKGILAYYKSQDEMHLGSKGSIKMACCEISVHQSDQCRLDLIIPGEQHFYVRGTSPAERQQWLVALGTSKACLTNTKALENEESKGTLKTKMSELRLYRDLLMQQVHAVKASTNIPDQPDIEKINDATSLLSATCDTFLRTLQDCMKIANETFTPQINQSTVSPGVLPPSLASPTEKRNPYMYRSQSVDRYTPPSHKGSAKTTYRNLEELASRPKYNRARSHSGSSSSPQSLSAPATPTSSTTPDGILSSSNSTKSLALESSSKNSNQIEERPMTIFSNMKFSFTDIETTQGDNIPTAPFLEAFRNLLPLFDALGATTFAPVKMDILGNIRKVNQKYLTDPEKFAYLQLIVEQEMRSNTTRVKNSATDALLWLKRALEYTYEFLAEIVRGERDLSVASGNAYGKSLKKFHGWVARGVYALVAKTVPYYQDFISLLALSKADYENPNFEKCMIEDLGRYSRAMHDVLVILQDFYTKHDLDFPDQV